MRWSARWSRQGASQLQPCSCCCCTNRAHRCWHWPHHHPSWQHHTSPHLPCTTPTDDVLSHRPDGDGEGHDQGKGSGHLEAGGGMGAGVGWGGRQEARRLCCSLEPCVAARRNARGKQFGGRAAAAPVPASRAWAVPTPHHTSLSLHHTHLDSRHKALRQPHVAPQHLRDGINAKIGQHVALYRLAP